MTTLMSSIINLEELRPSDIVGIKMDSNRIIHIWFHYPILNEDVDYEVALYIAERKLEFEKTNGKCLGLFVNITDYNRLDCVGLFDVTVPSPRVRQMHSDMHKDAIMKRAAYYKKETSRVAEVCVKMAAIYHNKEVRLFGDPEKAIRWLEDGVRLYHPEVNARTTSLSLKKSRNKTVSLSTNKPR